MVDLLLVCLAACQEAPEFEKDILPLFRAHCLKCHGDKKQKADLDLRTPAALLKGGETGPAMKPGSADASLLWEMISKDKMPPEREAKLTPEQKAVVRAWIEAGAKGHAAPPASAEGLIDRQVTDEDRDFWAFRKPARPPVPEVRRRDRVRNAIDAFLLAALEKQGLSMSPEADRVRLLRRVFYDLVGLPPSPEESEAFLSDPSSSAYERLVDRLLADPRYGERWGRHWLDLAGYADSEGILDADYVRSAAWRYRDYVIRAFNADRPYDRFLREQIAGDELVDYRTAYRTQKELSPEVVEGLVATGYLRCASDTSRPDFVSIKNAPGYYYQTLDDTLRIVGSSTLGLTVHCAKCHSHKYDPIPQTEYYRLQAVFMGAYRPQKWVPQVERRLLEATEVQEKEAKEHNAKVDAVVAPLRKQIQELQKQFGERLFAERLAKLPEAIREDVKAALATEAAKRTEVQKYLAEKFQKELRPDAAALQKLLPETYPDYKTRLQPLDASVKAEEAKKRTFPEIRALYDLPGDVETRLLRRGNYLDPGPAVSPGVLSVLAAPQPFVWEPGGKEAPTAGRRKAFAEWLTQPDHPLTARVLVNRIWLQHFGEGIVSTPDNFGRTGSPPSHPELLDWLATEFVANGWSLKALHRLMIVSSAYRQTSTKDPAARAQKVDPTNRLLWRQRMRRVEAEALRDAILSVAGTLNAERFGPPVPIQRRGDGEVVTADDSQGRRRSVYLQVRRSQPLSILQAFDQPVIETNCTRRVVSTVSSQALVLLNSDFMIRQAEAFADRILRQSPGDSAGHAVLLAFARPATADERALLGRFLEAQAGRYEKDAPRRALSDLCHMLLSANEFAYVD